MIHFEVDMDNRIKAFLKNVFLFRDVQEKTLDVMLKKVSPETKIYTSKEVIFSPHEYEPRLAFVISGECIVERIKSDETALPLNTLKTYDSFGIMSLFVGGEEYPTSVIAKKGAELIFFTKQDVDTLIKSSPEIAINVIKFLADRIAFLNSKIATFSSDTVEEKLANFLVFQHKKHGSTFLLNCKKTAEAINSGRASLYRALTSLERENIIKFENKKIFILDPEGLERISK